MRLELSLTDAADAVAHVADAVTDVVNVVVEAPRGTSLAQVHEHLVAALHPRDAAGDAAGAGGGAGHPGAVAWSADGALVAPGTALGAPPLLRGALLRAVRPGGRSSATAAGDAVAVVACGPSAGAVRRLPPGQHLVGRGAGCAVALEDLDASRHHAVLAVSPHGVRVRDPGSANGTRVRSPSGDEEGVGSTWTDLAAGSSLLLGSSTVRVGAPPHGARAGSPAGDGHVDVSTPPRAAPTRRTLALELPPAPPPPVPARLSVLAVVLPVALAVVMAVVWSPLALLFGLAAPVLAVGSSWGERRAQRREHRRALADHEQRCAGVRRAAAAAVADDLAALGALAPDPGEIALAAAACAGALWQRGRGGDLLLLRLGCGTVPSGVVVRGGGLDPPGADPPPESHADAPVVLALPSAGALGVAGPPGGRRGLARSLLLQAAVLHSPRHLRVVVLRAPGAPPGPDPWAWVRWLPHADRADQPLAALLQEVARRAAARAAASAPRAAPGEGEPAVLVLLDGAGSLRRSPGVAELLAAGPALGVHAVCLDDDAAALPVECGAVAQLSGPGGAVLHLAHTPGPVQPAPDQAAGAARAAWPWPACAAGSATRADLVPAAVAAEVARALAPLRDATPAAAALPRRLRLLDLLPLDATDPAAVSAAWARCPRTTRVLLGARAGHPWVVDLERDGPHVLVAGTTGSGKSELLATLVTSLAVGNRPDELALVLVDYKGGAAFADVAALPHAVGLVTDLDAHLTRRALASLQAEVHRRERVLAAAGCRDHAEHVRRRAAGELPGGPGGVGTETLPRLVVVVDEFRVLAEELPDFLGGLVRLAAVGRSLGVHLVLATQRPAGVVSADIRANTALRIALRVQDDADSLDVVESRDASRIDAGAPGRAVARSGAGPLVAVQAARVLGTAPPAGVAGVRVERLDDPPPGPTGAGVAPGGPSDVARVVEALRRAAAGLPSPRSPWLAPLPDVVRRGGPDTVGGQPTPAGDGAPRALVLGVRDLPRHQRREPLRWALDQGPLLVVGAPRSGRTSVLRAVLAAAADWSPAALHVHVVAAPSPLLAGVEGLPQVGALADPGDPERLLRLLHHLAALVRARQRAGAGAPSGGPTTLLLVDGADRVLADAAASPTAPGDDVGELLHRLLTDGPAVGVVPALAGDRSLLLGRVGAVARQRLLLAAADPADHVLAGVPAREVPGRMPPGRVLVLGGEDDDGSPVTEAQVAVLGTASDPAGRRAEVDALAAASARRWAEVAARPPAVPAVAQRVELADLLPCPGVPLPRGPVPPAGPGSPMSPRSPMSTVSTVSPAGVVAGVVVGVGEDGPGQPLHLGLEASPHWLVAGAPGTGRSTTLVTLGQAARARGHRLLVLAGPRSPVTTWARACGLPCPSPGDARAVAATLADLVGPGAGHGAAPPALAPLVLVDDVERLAASATEDLLLGAADGVALVAAGTTADLLAAYRGLGASLRRSRTGILLHPLGAGDGELLGVRLGRTTTGPPGRATLVDDGRARVLQVALPSAPGFARGAGAGRAGVLEGLHSGDGAHPAPGGAR